MRRRLAYAATVAAALAATPLICLLQWLAGIEWDPTEGTYDD